MHTIMYNFNFWIIYLKEKILQGKKEERVRVRPEHVPDTKVTVEMKEHSPNPRAPNSSVQTLTYRLATVHNMPRVHKIKRY